MHKKQVIHVMECVDVATFLGQRVEYDCACFELQFRERRP